MPPAMEIDYVLSMNSDWKPAEVECVDPHGYDEAGDLLFERDAEVPFVAHPVLAVRGLRDNGNKTNRVIAKARLHFIPE